MENKTGWIVLLVFWLVVLWCWPANAEWIVKINEKSYRPGVNKIGDIIEHRPDNGRPFSAREHQMFDIVHIPGRTWAEIEKELDDSDGGKYPKKTSKNATQLESAIQLRAIIAE